MRECSPLATYHVSDATFHMSNVTGHMSHVKKSRIREQSNLLTDADSSTETATFGDHFGCHFWGPFLTATFGIRFQPPLLWSTFDRHFWGPLLTATFGVQFWPQLLGSFFNRHFWPPLLRSTFNRHFWGPLWTANERPGYDHVI